MGNDKTYVPNTVDISCVPKQSPPGAIFNFTCSGNGRVRESHEYSSQTFFSSTDGKR